MLLKYIIHYLLLSCWYITSSYQAHQMHHHNTKDTKDAKDIKDVNDIKDTKDISDHRDVSIRSESGSSKRLKSLYSNLDSQYFKYTVFCAASENHYFIINNTYHEIPKHILPLFEWNEKDEVDDIDKYYQKGEAIAEFHSSESTSSTIYFAQVMEYFHSIFTYGNALGESHPKNRNSPLPKLVISTHYLTNMSGLFNGAAIPAFNFSDLDNNIVKYAYTNRNIKGAIAIANDITMSDRSKITISNPLTPGLTIGEDFRLFPLPNGNILMIFTQTVKSSHHVALKVLDTTKMALSPLTILIQHNDEARPKRKNWGPFIYHKKKIKKEEDSQHTSIPSLLHNVMTNNDIGSKISDSDELDLYFIDFIQPLKIVHIEKKSHMNKNLLPGYELSTNYYHVVSMEECDSLKPSAFGHLRGGTPALYIRDRYLAFYHTAGSDIMSRLFDIDFKMEYTFGAYTFSNKKPFKLTAISPHPITTPDLLTSIELLSEMKLRARNPYLKHYLVVFPMTFYLETIHGRPLLHGEEEEDPLTTRVVLTMGKYDTDTYVVKLNLNHLLHSLMPLDC